MKRLLFVTLGLGSALFLFLFLLFPLWGVVERAFHFSGNWDGRLFVAAVKSPVVFKTLGNSLLLGLWVVFFSSLIALPLALVQSKYQFFGKSLLNAITLFPLILPPFVGAVGLLRFLGRYGLLNDWLGITPYDWMGGSGLVTVAFLQALHLYPIIYLNLTSALSNVDPQLTEAAQLVGASPFRRFKDVTLPLSLPGLLGGAVVVFLWAVTDIGTPMVMGYRGLISVEIFDRVSSVGNDPTGSALVLFVVLLTFTLVLPARRWLSGEGSTGGSKGVRSQEWKKLSMRGSAFVYALVAGVAFLTLLPHALLVLTAFTGDWFLTPLPESLTTAHFGGLADTPGVAAAVRNSLLYSTASALLDVVLGFGLAYVVSRKLVRLGGLLDGLVMLPLVLPGIVLAFGYVAAYTGTPLDPLKNPVPLLIAGYAIRRLPFVFRASYAALQQVGPAFEDAARVSGASRLRSVLDVTLPLSLAGVLGGALLAFLFAMLEVSESLILAVKESFFPLTRAIYLLLWKLPEGETEAAALGVLCMVGMGAGLVAASLLLGKQLGKLFRA